MKPERLNELMEQRKLLNAPQPTADNALSCIQCYLDDHTGTYELSEEHKKIYDRWKYIYNLKLDGKTSDQIVSHVKKLFGVSDRTVRYDLNRYAKAFTIQFDAEFELRVIYHKCELQYQKYKDMTNPKFAAIAQKYLAQMERIATELNLDTPLDPDKFIPGVFVVTVNPKDIGIEDDIPSTDELFRKYHSKRKKTDSSIEEADVVE